MANSLKNKFKYSALAALIVTLLSCTVMAFTGFGFGAPAETANADTGISAQSNAELAAAWNSAVESGGTFTLTEDWVAAADATNTTSFGTGTGFSNGRIYVPAGKNVVLDLNGHTLNRGLSSGTYGSVTNGNVIYVEGALEICDTSASQNGKITGGYLFGDGYGAGINVNGGNLTITSGNIINNEADHAFCGGVYVKNGTLTMNGGTISGNENYAGTTVQLENSTFIMNSGEILNNTGSVAGVSVNSGSTFEMNGGAISGNSTNNENSGSVYVDGTFTMTGGEISNNTGSNGVGVYVYREGKFEMSAGKISGNTSNNSATNGRRRL